MRYGRASTSNVSEEHALQPAYGAHASIAAAPAARPGDTVGPAGKHAEHRARTEAAAHEMGHGAGMSMADMARDMRNRFYLCLAFAVPILIWAPMGLPMPTPAPPFGLALDQWLFVLATGAVVWPGWPFVTAAWRALKSGVLNMAVLVVLSVGTGYVFSVATTFIFGGVQFFEAVSVLLAFILLGHWLEMRARAGANDAIRALILVAVNALLLKRTHITGLK